MNDAPSLTYSVGGTWSEAISGDSDPLLFLSSASANDIDGEHYNGGSIQIDLDEYFTGDRLIFVDGNGFTSSNGSIALNGVEVATIDASYDGTDKAFKINFTSDSVTDTVVEGLLEQIGYNSVSHNATNSGLLPTRSVSVTLRDGGNEGDSGGEKEITFTPVSNTFDFLTLNDSPLISAGLSTFNNIHTERRAGRYRC